MDLIGHCAVAAASGVHRESEIFGPGLLALMLPNALHCHDWAYGHVWELDRFPARMQSSARLVRTHIVADWVIHYGCKRTDEKRKCGWAYRRMGAVHSRAHAWFGEADRAGLLRSGARLPVSWSKKQRLDFAHSLVEYAVDAILAPEVCSPVRLRSICRHLSSLADPVGGGRRIVEIFHALGAVSDQSSDFLDRSIASLAHDGAHASHPIDFAVGTTIRKYHFYDSPAARRFVRSFIEEVASGLCRSEVEELVVEIARYAGRPAQIYSGNWTGGDVNATGPYRA